MEFRKIHMFVEVVRCNGFSKAAEALYSTQSTVSKAVRQLEDEVGLPLLERGARGVTMTTCGEVVYRRGLRMLAEQEDLIDELAAIQGLKKGRVKLGLPQIGAAALFAPVFTRFRQRFPGVDIRLVEQGSDEMARMLRAGELELAGTLLPADEDFDWIRVRREPLVALVANSLAPAGKGPVRVKEFKEMPFLLFQDGFALNRIILGICQRYGFKPQVVTRSSQISFICELVAAGLGVAFMPRMVARLRMVPGIRMVPLVEEDLVWDMSVAWRRGAFLSHAARAWLDVVREVYPAQDSSLGPGQGVDSKVG